MPTHGTRDAGRVDVDLPANLSGDPAIVVRDNGIGMTFAECQDFYLNVGRNRRVDEETDKSPNGRPVLGRKGIGKFAGFGIAGVLEIDTTSARTGERTIFRLDLQDLRSDSYIGTNAKEVPVLLREPESEARKPQRGTSVTMKRLTVGRTPSRSVFSDFDGAEISDQPGG